jgi:hypothetical protein
LGEWKTGRLTTVAVLRAAPGARPVTESQTNWRIGDNPGSDHERTHVERLFASGALFFAYARAHHRGVEARLRRSRTESRQPMKKKPTRPAAVPIPGVRPAAKALAAELSIGLLLCNVVVRQTTPARPRRVLDPQPMFC